MAKPTKDIWNRDKDGNKKEQRSFLRYAIVATALFIVFLFLKKDSIVTWVQAGFTLRRQERQIEQLRQENEELDRRIRMMKGDRDTLERFAREHFYFAEPGDDVYIIE
ncbi:MAG: septum formation initiator family protein [Bacteroidales bacterium]|jgi:cell division protein FtsB|nr:septum formation initiator family protein [Bacteroidales bacterium]